MQNSILHKPIFISIALIIFAITSIKAQAPTISSFAPSSGPIGTLVTVNGSNLTSASNFTIGGVSAIVVSNTDTQIVGIVMPNATTGNISVATANGTITSTSGFTITTTSYPSAQQGNKLVGINSSSFLKQGYATAISADGNTAIVGVPDFSINATNMGGAYIFVRNNNVWTQQGNKLVGTGSTGNAQQGMAVAISADGNTAVIGGDADNSYTGAAWIFTRTELTWSQQGNKLVGSNSIGQSWQGSSVSIIANGNTVVVGGKFDNTNAGAIWIYERTASSWAEVTKLNIASSTPLLLGRSVAISADGNTIAAGTLTSSVIFIKAGSTYIQQGSPLIPTGSTNSNNVGISVALNADGNTLIIGGDDNYISYGIGAAWVFTRTGTAWTMQKKLQGTGNTAIPTLQGHSVAISADGNTAIVGGYLDNYAFNGTEWVSQGATWVFTRIGTTWTQQGSKLVGTGNTGAAHQGFSVALSADGNTALAGGITDNNNQGATWVFVSSILVPLQLISFDVAEKENIVTLNWQTANEINTSHFNIQRSINGVEFINVGKINTTNTNSSKYSFNDDVAGLSSNIIYYRLQMADKDGSFTYSKIIPTNLNAKDNITIYPNPVKSSLYAQVKGNGKAILQIVDMQGKVLQQQLVQLNGGSTSVNFNTSTLVKGCYVLVVISEDGITKKVFIKE